MTFEAKYQQGSYVLLPVSITTFVLACYSKPKRTDVSYKRFLYFHFFSFALIGEVFYAVQDFRMATKCSLCEDMDHFGIDALLALVRLSSEIVIFRQMLKLRESVAKLPPQELSEFLCQTILVKGIAAIGPMIFFSFETVACYLSQMAERLEEN